MPTRRWRGSLPPQHPAPNIWGPYPTAVLADTPFAYYRLGDNTGTPKVLDNSGNGLDLTIVGAPTFQQSGAFPSDPNTSILGDGSTNDLERITPPNPVTTGGFTAECWVRSPAGGNFSPVSSPWSMPSNSAIASNRLQIGLGGTFSTFFSIGSITSPVNLSYDDWHHIVATWNSSTTAFTLYLNGVQIAQSNMTGPLGMTQGGISVGVDWAAVGAKFKGYIQDVAVYQYDLSASRVLAHYNLGAPTRHRPVDITSVARSGERRFLQFTGRRDPARGKVWNSPPWPQAAENTNGYFNRPNHIKWQRQTRQWQRRGHVWGFPWPVAPVVSTFVPQVVHRQRSIPIRRGRGSPLLPITAQDTPIVIGKPRTPRNWIRQRKTNTINYPWAQAFPPNPVWPIARNQSFVVRGFRQWQRRGHIWWPTDLSPPITFQIRQPNTFLTKRQWQRRGRNYMVWPQADPLTNGYWQPKVNRQIIVESARQWQRRGKIWVPVPLQELPPATVYQPVNSKRQYKAPRKGLVWNYPWQQAYPPNPLYPIQVNRQRFVAAQHQWQRRGRQWWPTPVTIFPNPPITFQDRQLLRAAWRQYQRRGHYWLAWPQANPLTNGYFLNPNIHQFRLQWLDLWRPQQRVWSPHLDQAFPPNPNRQQWEHHQTRIAWLALWRPKQHVWEPFWPQQAGPQPAVIFQDRQFRIHRIWQRRGHVWSPHLDQAFPPNPVWPISHNGREAWRLWRQPRGHEWTASWFAVPVVAPSIVLQRQSRNLLRTWFTKRPTIVHNVVPPQLDQIRDAHYRQNRYGLFIPRRGKLWTPTPVQPSTVNPVITEWQVRRAYRRWYEYAKRHRVWSPHLDQAYPPNPPTVIGSLHLRRVPVYWIAPRRGAQWHIGFGLTVSPVAHGPAAIYIIDEIPTAFFSVNEAPIALFSIDDELYGIYLANEGQT